MEGEPRSEQQQEPTEESAVPAKEEQKQEKPAAPIATPGTGPRVVTMPTPAHKAEELEEEIDDEEEEGDAPLPEPPTAEEASRQKTDYDKSSANLDEMLRAANPGMPSSHQVNFEHLVQQLYLSAMMQMGAGTPEGERPRIDILGARQTVDLMGVLSEKTKGNLSEREERMLQSALFELRMNFLELTNMISKSATQPPPGGKR
jgi:Domain of unknown function (DUF1844)